MAIEDVARQLGRMHGTYLRIRNQVEMAYSPIQQTLDRMNGVIQGFDAQAPRASQFTIPTHPLRLESINAQEPHKGIKVEWLSGVTTVPQNRTMANDTAAIATGAVGGFVAGAGLSAVQTGQLSRREALRGGVGSILGMISTGILGCNHVETSVLSSTDTITTADSEHSRKTLIHHQPIGSILQDELPIHNERAPHVNELFAITAKQVLHDYPNADQKRMGIDYINIETDYGDTFEASIAEVGFQKVRIQDQYDPSKSTIIEQRRFIISRFDRNNNTVVVEHALWSPVPFTEKPQYQLLIANPISARGWDWATDRMIANFENQEDNTTEIHLYPSPSEPFIGFPLYVPQLNIADAIIEFFGPTDPKVAYAEGPVTIPTPNTEPSASPTVIATQTTTPTPSPFPTSTPTATMRPPTSTSIPPTAIPPTVTPKVETPTPASSRKDITLQPNPYNGAVANAGLMGIDKGSNGARFIVKGEIPDAHIGEGVNLDKVANRILGSTLQAIWVENGVYYIKADMQGKTVVGKLVGNPETEKLITRDPYTSNRTFGIHPNQLGKNTVLVLFVKNGDADAWQQASNSNQEYIVSILGMGF